MPKTSIKRSSTLKAALVTTALLVSLGATADFRIVGNDQYISEQEKRQKQREIQAGMDRLNRVVQREYSLLADNRERPLINHGQPEQGAPKKIYGFGMEMALNEALIMVIPQDWTAYLHHNIQNPNTISWKAEGNDGQEWTQVLENIMADLDYTAEVHWDEQTITIREAQYTQTRKLRDEPARITDSDGNTFYITQDEPIGAGSLLINGVEYEIDFQEQDDQKQ